jgi:ethanolamine ammonia-lyase small subunit
LSSIKKYKSQKDPWHGLKQFTNARIALGRAGNALPVDEVLKIKLAHANARDAVYSQIDIAALQHELLKIFDDVLLVKSKVQSRPEYLQRPDLGRKLFDDDAERLKQTIIQPGSICIIVADGLSANAINKHALPVLQHLHMHLETILAPVAPICIATEARVALGDEIGSLLDAAITILLIGERPGLSSPESMSAYITYNPHAGCTDEARNCISNIRPEGLPYDKAAEKIFYLLQQSLQLKYSGVLLKDNQFLLANRGE